MKLPLVFAIGYAKSPHANLTYTQWCWSFFSTLNIAHMHSTMIIPVLKCEKCDAHSHSHTQSKHISILCTTEYSGVAWKMTTSIHAMHNCAPLETVLVCGERHTVPASKVTTQLIKRHHDLHVQISIAIAIVIAFQSCGAFELVTFLTVPLLFQFNFRFTQAVKLYDMLRLTKWQKSLLEWYKNRFAFIYIGFHYIFFVSTSPRCDLEMKDKVNFISRFSNIFFVFYCAITRNARFFALLPDIRFPHWHTINYWKFHMEWMNVRKFQWTEWNS